jgi:hypothetical protein
MIEIDELTLYWLAGLLEGEGSFCVGLPSHPNSSSIHIKMVDEEVIAKVSAIWGVKYHRYFPKRYEASGWRPVYVSKVTGRRAVEFMMLLCPLMGKRRQGQIDRAIASFSDLRRALTPEKMEEIRRRSQNGENVLELAKEYGISKSLAYYIRGGYTYKQG